MNPASVSTLVGARIRACRKNKRLTLQQLADQIHKSRATVSKYETGEISMDLETLAEIARALEVAPGKLMELPPEPAQPPVPRTAALGMNPFFQARRLYFYFYDGRYQRLKDGIIDIQESRDIPGSFEAVLSISTVWPSGRSSQVYYSGKVVYSDMLIRFSFVNQYNPLEEDLLYIFNPLELRDSTEGLLCGISSADLMPCAFKCLVTLTPQEHTDAFRKSLLLTKEELQRWQRLNMLIVGNREF